METGNRHKLATSVLVVVVIFVILVTFILTSYSTTVSCGGVQVIPSYIAHFSGNTISYSTQTIVQQVNTTSKVRLGRIGSLYSTTINYTTAVVLSGSTVTLYGGYANLTCTYIK